MKNIHRIVLGFFLIPLFSYATEKHDHVKMVLEQAKKCFGDKINYKELEISLTSNNITNQAITKHYATSKNGHTLFVYSERNDREYGLFDLITLESFENLKKDKKFQKYAFPVIASIKVWTKKHNIKMPKPLVHIFLKEGFTHYSFDHEKNRESRYFQRSAFDIIKWHFPQYKSTTVFVDDNKNVAVNLKDENNNNILYTHDKQYDNLWYLIMPLQMPNNRLIIHHELCSPGTTQQVTIKYKINPHNYRERSSSQLKVKKDNKKYIIDLPF